MRRKNCRLLAATLLAAGLWPAPTVAQAIDDKIGESGPAARLARSLEDPALRSVVAEILERNAELAGAAARARAAALRAPQVRALPDPMVGLTAFLAPPETRVGPQRLMLSASQRLPGFGKLALAEQAAVLEAAALAAEVEARRLELITEGRRLWCELAFQQRQREITAEFRRHLDQHEEIARTRYATGIGSGQGVVKLQAEITRVDSRLLDIRERQAALAARLDGLRDRPGEGLAAAAALPGLRSLDLDRGALERLAFERRPELAAAAARLAGAETLQQLAERQFRPDFTLGLTYTLVDRRRDEPGRLQPPPGNGNDVFGLQGGVTLPVRRGKLRAGLEQARVLRLAAEESRRAAQTRIAADLDELAGRIPLAWRQLRLLHDVLIVQAEEALDSARAGYVAGTLNALDLLDAEHVLFDAHTAVARAAADFAIYLARLEGVVAEPLEVPQP
jgi:outer membrane protein TolC